VVWNCGVGEETMGSQGWAHKSRPVNNSLETSTRFPSQDHPLKLGDSPAAVRTNM
jgi:hypothetical protein